MAVEMPCWITREEAMGWPQDSDARARCLDLMPAGDVAALRAMPEEAGWNYAIDEAYQWIKAMCELRTGHPGEHVFAEPSTVHLLFPRQEVLL